MRFVRSFSVVAIALSFGAVAFGARSAEAATCCSNPKCQVENPPSYCYWCTPTCAEEGETAIVEDGVVYDEVDSICYPASDLESAPSQDCEASTIVDAQ